MIVLVHPTTKRPTGFEPDPDSPRCFTGPHQNVTEVTGEWLAAEWKRLIAHQVDDSICKILEEHGVDGHEKIAAYVLATVAAERGAERE